MKEYGLDKKEIDEIIERGLTEDLGSGDITTDSLFPPDAMAEAEIKVKEEGVLAGLPVAEAVFRRLDPDIKWDVIHEDGSRVKPGDIAVKLKGRTRAILTAERLALNFLQRLSGIATLTSRYTDAVKHTNTKILDTRKTVPGLRLLDKYAVRTGGGKNHRTGLFDMVLIKDNHIAFAGGIENAVKTARNKIGEGPKIEVEIISLNQLEEAIGAGVDIVMLDNMSTHEMKKAVELNHGRVLLEASGGVSLETVAEIAATGVDYISVGALTHSPKALDISLDLL